MTRPAPPDEKTTVFFDGSCPLCRAEIDLYRRGDPDCALRFVDVSAENAALPDGLARSEAMARFHVLSAEGRLISGAAAFAEVWRRLPGWRPVGRLARLPGVLTALEACYRLFLPLRPTIARGLAFATHRRGLRASVRDVPGA